MELIDRQFYQLSCDDAMVAIMADYPGLLSASHIRKIKKSQLQKLGSPFRHFTYHIHMVFLQGRHSGRHAEPATTRQQEAPRPGRPKRKAVRAETPTQRYDKNPTPWLSCFSKCNDVHVSLTEKTLAGICPVRLPIMLPPVGLQGRT